MGHAIHFLQRLKRLSTPQVEFALEVYRNPELIRFILEHSKLPDRAERVALAVSNRPDGPHIIVARDGGFVTCLGPDMSIGDHPVVTRQQLRGLSKRFDVLREANERANDRVHIRRLFKNLSTKGSAFSREDFQTLSAIMPMFARSCLSALFEMVDFQLRFQQRYKRTEYRRLNKWVKRELRCYWDTWWAIGHLTALCGIRGRELVDRPVPGIDVEHLPYHLAMAAMHSTIPAVMLRGGWTAARGGRLQAAKAKDMLRNARSFMEVIASSMGLMVASLRHRKLRAEGQKLINRALRSVDSAMCGAEDTLLSTAILERWADLFDPKLEQEARTNHRLLGAIMVVDKATSLPPDHPHRFERPEDVPDDLALAMPMSIDDDILSNPTSMYLMSFTLPWMAEVDAADFYLPAQWLETFSTPWRPETALTQLNAHHTYFLRDQPIRSGPKPGRNQPCPCGSSTKYKRCCGR